MFQEYNMRTMLGFLLVIYGIGLLLWMLNIYIKKRKVDKVLLICGIILIVTGIFSVSLRASLYFYSN